MASSFLEYHKELLKGVKPFKERMKNECQDEVEVIQQSDYLKNFMLCILNSGLHEAYAFYGSNPPGPNPQIIKQTTFDVDYDVIVVGAGVAGLSAAYELKRADLSVKILEQTDRIGGRVFTYGPEKGLADGLFAEAGAMRLPGGVECPTNRPHFLTDGYIQKFGLQIKAFPNSDPETLTNIYGFHEKTSEWAAQYFNTVWPEWKIGIDETIKDDITNIDKYYEQTTAVVTEQLRLWLINTNTVDEEIVAWNRWISIWSQFTLESFLESNIDVILAKVPEADRTDLDVEALGKLLPWSNDAVRGYSVFSYTEQLDQSLVQFLRDQMGKWWSPDMHCLVGGMHSFPEAFFSDEHLSQDDIAYNKYVSKICYTFTASDVDGDRVTVTCYPYNNEQESSYTARAIIVTTPVNVLRQITFKPEADDPESNENLRKSFQAIEDIFVAPSTKIFLQTKTRFWEKPGIGINGGFSKTNMPIGQLHYVKPDPESCAEQGILLIYTWKNEAIIFGSMPEENVQREVIEQIAEIHPEINEPDGEVSVCIVHAWQNQPSYQGAYGLLKTTQFDNIRYLWEPMGNVHFAGETISFTTGWIQGALESGFKSAYQVYERFMENPGTPRAQK